MRLLVRFDLAPRTTMLFTVPGRRSGIPHSTPVTLVEEDGQRWLVAPYGPVAWVRNARATGQVKLSRGRRSETVRVKELAPEAAAPILKAYMERVPITRPYFDVAPDAPLAAFAAEASRHPVFQVVS
jgi:deazaflavin-dependent oxidoreductase (nitroreductase family)